MANVPVSSLLSDLKGQPGQNLDKLRCKDSLAQLMLLLRLAFISALPFLSHLHDKDGGTLC